MPLDNQKRNLHHHRQASTSVAAKGGEKSSTCHFFISGLLWSARLPTYKSTEFGNKKWKLFSLDDGENIACNLLSYFLLLFVVLRWEGRMDCNPWWLCRCGKATTGNEPGGQREKVKKSTPSLVVVLSSWICGYNLSVCFRAMQKFAPCNFYLQPWLSFWAVNWRVSWNWRKFLKRGLWWSMKQVLRADIYHFIFLTGIRGVFRNN